jgi:ATP-dependent protease HslVU (ClpYQ) peptidase subunit
MDTRDIRIRIVRARLDHALDAKDKRRVRGVVQAAAGSQGRLEVNLLRPVASDGRPAAGLTIRKPSENRGEPVTVIVAALTKDQGVVMAADRQVTMGARKANHEQPKLWVSGQYAFGACGCLRTAQVLKHHVTWPKFRPDEDKDWEKFLVMSVVPAIYEGVQNRGVMTDSSGVRTLDMMLCIATGEHSAVIYGNGCVIADNTGRSAIGSGSAQALGSLGDKGPWAEADVVTAAHRAAETAVGVDGPISVVDTKTLTVRTAE